MKTDREDKSTIRSGHGGAHLVPGCGCSICLRIAAHELGLSAPYTPAAWRMLEQHCGMHVFSGPPSIDVDVAGDPDVASAASALAVAEATYNVADDARRDTIAEVRETELLTNSVDDLIAAKAKTRGVQLRSELIERGAERDRLWAKVVKIRGILAAATRTAQQRAIDGGAYDSKAAPSSFRKTVAAAEQAVHAAIGQPKPPPSHGGTDHHATRTKEDIGR